MCIRDRFMCSPGCFKGERETVFHEQRHDSLWQKGSEVVPCKQSSSLSLSCLRANILMKRQFERKAINDEFAPGEQHQKKHDDCTAIT